MQYSDLVQLLVQAREDRGWSQTDLAHRMGVTPASINHWESMRRQTSLDNLREWAQQLGYEVAFELQSTRSKPRLSRAVAEQVSVLSDEDAKLVGHLVSALTQGNLTPRERFSMTALIEAHARPAAPHPASSKSSGGER